MADSTSTVVDNPNSVYTDPDNMTKVEAQILMWDGEKWLEISNTRTTNQINDHVKQVEDAVAEAQKGITDAVDTANQADSKADTAITNAGFATDTATTAKQVATTALSNVSQKADSISSTVTNNKTSSDYQFSTINQKITGIQSTVANKADSSTVTQLNTLVQSKVSTSDYNSKITQLSSDINLRVQTSNLLSQINLAAGTTLIQSNKIYLDADSVVFGGKAFITDAMIANLSADKITAGKLSANLVDIDNGVLKATAVDSGILIGQGEIFVNNKDASQTLDMMSGFVKLTSTNGKNGSGTLQTSITGSSVNFYGNTSSLESNQARISFQGGLTYDDYMNGKTPTGISFNNYGNIVPQAGSANWAVFNKNGNRVLTVATGTGKTDVVVKSNLFLADTDNDWSNGWTYNPFAHMYKDGANNFCIAGTEGDLALFPKGALSVHSDINTNTHFLNGFYFGGNNMKSGGPDLWVDAKNGAGGNATIHVKSVSQQSLLSLKTNITDLDGKQALKTLDDTDVKNYSYKDDLARGSNKRYTTAIIDDVNDKPRYNTPIQFLSEDGKGRDDGTMLGYAIAAIKELHSQVKELQA